MNALSYFVGGGRYNREITVFPRKTARRLFKICNKRIGAYGKRALNRGWGSLLSSPVGNQAYLSYIVQFTHRVVNKEAIETGFPYFPTTKKWWGGDRGRLIEGVHVWYFGPTSRRLLERGRYTKKILQFLKQNQNQPSLYRKLRRP